MGHDLLAENEVIETRLIVEACEIAIRMKINESGRPRPYFEKYLRQRIRLALLDVRIREAERCETYRMIGSPRVIELKSARNTVNVEIAKLEAEERKTP